MAIQTVTKEELKEKIEKNEPVQVVNVLSPEAWAEGVIKNSKKIPLPELEARVAELDKSKEVVTYCANVRCNASKQAAELLQKKGFRVKAYEGGIQEWKESGFPLEK